MSDTVPLLITCSIIPLFYVGVLLTLLTDSPKIAAIGGFCFLDFQ